jgi:subtilisin family serine protease
VPCFANTSDTLDLLAPGAPIRATGLGGRTSTYYGTSQATAHASAAAAVLLELDPRLNPDEIIAALKLTGVPVADPRNGLVFPRLDLLGAVNWLGVR